MSLYKRIWIDKDPAYAGFRAAQTADAWKKANELVALGFRIPTRRRNVFPGAIGRWCPFWANRVSRAADELEIEFIHVNDGMYFHTKAERDQTFARAEELWRETLAQRMR